ncbi:component of oligomeric golgi complex 6 [Zalerion maritima]|uniref:Conserved oligomeric Golgi complex subunit 6 n=1 Tax=Zalerion maritima TaxID=339359 RepID=A0AAD5WWG7_9PEZI|nr:component of oligomeric golgi complex 6 [Zalerion maritima]
MTSNSPLSLGSLPTFDPTSTGPTTPGTPSTPGLASLKGLNPVSAKVITVLSTSYADSEFRESLALLDGRGVKNTSETRRNLRLDIQKEVIESNAEIIDEFGKVAEQLKRIGTTINRLNQTYKPMKDDIESAHEETFPFLEEATKLMSQKQKVEKKQNLLDRFNDHFILSEDEVAIITQSSEPVNSRFFDVLEKAKKISKDCDILLGIENQTLGLEITEQNSKHLNHAFQKIYRWIQREFKTLNLENPQISSDVRRALRVLAERPSLFKNCLDFFAEAREQILSDSFYTALTGTSRSGEEERTVKPIELVAHDILRYVGDMLAWTHSATVSEREALEVLFVAEGEEIARGIEASEESGLRRLAAEESEETPHFDSAKALNDLVDRDVSGVARLLRQRIEEVIHANEETIPAYKLANLLNFYRVTFTKLLGSGAVLLECLGNLEKEALRQFRSLMRDHIATLQGEFQHTPTDLGAPDFLLDALKQLKDIMKTYDTSLTPLENREADFEDILIEAFDPFVEGCKNMARRIPSPSSFVFLINSLMTSRAAIQPYSFTRSRIEDLGGGIEDAADQLIESQYRFFRQNSGLSELFQALFQVKSNDAPGIRALGPVQPAALQEAGQVLDDFLPSALMDAMEEIKHLQDSKLASEVTEEAAEKFCGDFDHVETLLTYADGALEEEYEEKGKELPGNKRLRAHFPRTSAEIKGNEGEAMQYWKRALDQINEYHATRSFNPNPRSEIDKELQKSLRDLEVQCKERIDLLEALRISRVDHSPSVTPSVYVDESTLRSEKGYIGDGTIPAVSYPDLPRPPLPQRPSAQSRTSSEKAVVGGSARSSLDVGTPYSKPSAIPYVIPSPRKQSRSNSPDKPQHVMRTTLRSGKPHEKNKLQRRQPGNPTEGPGAGKAATIAWTKETPARRTPLDMSASATSAPNLSGAVDASRKVSGPAGLKWDSHSRRLVTPRETDPNVVSQRLTKGDKLDPVPSGRQSGEEYPFPSPNLLSISAASSALTNHYQGDAQSSDPEPKSSRGNRQMPQKPPGYGRPSRYYDLPPSPKADAPEVPEKRSSSLDLPIRRKPIAGNSGTASANHTPSRPPSNKPSSSQKPRNRQRRGDSSSSLDDISETPKGRKRSSLLKEKEKERERSLLLDSPTDKSEEASEEAEDMTEAKTWKKRKVQVMKNLPSGVDQAAAKQILNEIVVKGDEVHWGDIAGLDVAKGALRETVVYPFLRPDLFMGLREPARGMLLFGPPGTGKTMLARAVATESLSTFFSISASSLTSKYLGESEKLVRALFGLAKMLAPSIIFVDEIDSLLSQRSGSGEHEATRRIKTEFLIQWSDLQRAAAGRDVSDKDKERGDANRVLVLAATNLPWAIDEAARRRFVRRQYIPLPEEQTRAVQVKTLLGQQKHTLNDEEIEELVRDTEGFSGSDITALAKDAAMGPLRSLGEAVLTMKMDEIRPIGLEDFEASLKTIRPSVSKEGLKEYEDWAKKYGERGG